MTELQTEKKQDYGSTNGTGIYPLLKDQGQPLPTKDQGQETKQISTSKLPFVIGLDNAVFRHTVFALLLTTWLLPAFLAEVIALSENGCIDPQFCDARISSYVLIMLAMGFYKWMFMYLWYKDFSDSVRHNKCIPLLKYLCGALLFIGGIVLTVAILSGLNDLCIGSNEYCKAGTFGIYLFPILIVFALSADILLFRYDIGSNIRVRCSICSVIIFVSSLLITADLFCSDTSFESVNMGFYQCGWLMTCIISLFICIYVIFGFYERVKEHSMKRFYAVSFLYLALYIGPTLTLISSEGYMDVSRTTFLVLGLCVVLNVELFLL